MSQREEHRHRTGSARWAAALLLVGTLILLQTASLAEPPGLAQPDFGPGMSPCGAGDPIANALCNALQAYSRGETATARSWAALASKLLSEIATSESSSKPSPTGNAAQLLEMLQLYAVYAHGTQPELDAEYEALVPELERIDALNHDATKPDHLGPDSVDYHLITHLVTRIGEMRVDYHLMTLQITKLGDTSIDYNLQTRMPEKIGGIEIDYNLIDGRVTKIAGVEVR